MSATDDAACAVLHRPKYFAGSWNFLLRNVVCAGREQVDRRLFSGQVAGRALSQRATVGSVARSTMSAGIAARGCAATTTGKFAGRIQCPYHGWTPMDWTAGCWGSARPMSNVQHGYPLHAVRGGLGEACFSIFRATPTPLLEQLADLPRDSRHGRCRTPRLQAARLRGEPTETDRAELQRMPALPHLASAPDITDTARQRQRYAAIDLCGGSMLFRGTAQTMSMDGQRRRDYLPGLNEEQRKQVLYYAVCESAAQLASGLCAGAPVVAAGSGSDTGDLRWFSSYGNG